MPRPTVIIGAGLAGLSCAFHLRSEYVLIESEARVGGLASTTCQGGFSFDRTGHWLHLREPSIKALVFDLLAGRVLPVERRAEVDSDGVRTCYPFQVHTHGLPIEVTTSCVLGFLRAGEERAVASTQAPGTLEEFIYQHLGTGIAEHFMLPYNGKLYATAPRDLSCTWCARFVPQPTARQVLYGGILPPTGTSALGYNAAFFYPETGGIGRLADALACRLPRPPRLKVAAERIDWRSRRVTLSDEAVLGYDVLVSTMPLPLLIARLTEPPEQIAAAAARLRATSVTYWDVALAGANRPTEAHWTYFPHQDVPFYRVGSASAVVASLAPPRHRSYCVEVAHRAGHACEVTDAQILSELRQARFLGPGEEPLACTRRAIACAYVIMDNAYAAARKELLTWLESQRILSIGRYGSWTYDGMEGAMLQGRSAAKTVERLADRSVPVDGHARL